MRCVYNKTKQCMVWFGLGPIGLALYEYERLRKRLRTPQARCFNTIFAEHSRNLQRRESVLKRGATMVRVRTPGRALKKHDIPSDYVELMHQELDRYLIPYHYV